MSKLPPLDSTEIRQMWRNGEALVDIAEKARKRNGLSRAAVRKIIFGDA